MRGALSRATALAVLIAAASCVEAQAQAPSTAELAAEIQALRAQIDALQARLDAQVAAAPAAEPATPPPAAAAASPPLTVVFDGGPRLSVGGNSLKVRGRMLLDAIRQDIDLPGPGADVRLSQVRGRQVFLGVEGNIGPQWYYKLEGGAANGGGWGWDDAIIEYRHDARNSVIIGNQKGVGLENLTSTRFTSFLDRGPMDNLIDASYHLGVHYWRTGRAYSFNAGVTGHTLNSPDVAFPGPGAEGRSERLAASARASLALVNDADTTVHLATWARHRRRGDEAPLAYATGYNSPLRTQSGLATGAVGRRDLALGLEGAWVQGPVSVQGEVANMRVTPEQWAAASDFDLRAGYVFASFFPTGERRAYSTRGEFGRTRVLNPLGQGGFGALELLVRYDFADFSDALSATTAPPAFAGDYRAATLGATWTPINYVRFMANYTRGRFDYPGQVDNARVEVMQVRAQIDW